VVVGLQSADRDHIDAGRHHLPDHLASIATRVVVPLAKPEVLERKSAARLNPIFVIDGVRVVMLTPELAGVPFNVLGAKVATLESQRAEILAALDLVFTGI
jgi:toxin CcdB